MLTTSHFIGLEIRSTELSDLYGELQDFFRDNELLEDLELQNPLSPHITLYYLDSELSEDEHRQIRTLIKDTTRDDIQLTGLQVKYFGEAGSERVCYIGCDQNSALSGLNQIFTQAIDRDHAAENSLAFVAHISLFRIKQQERFAQYKKDIELIINTFLTQLAVNNLMGEVALYAVNSKYHPEIQIKLT